MRATMTQYINMTAKDPNEKGIDKRLINTVEKLKILNSNKDLNEKNVIELMSEFVPLITKSSNVNYQYNGPIAFGIYTFPAFCTLLHIAARFNCPRLVDYLTKAGADPNLQDRSLCTPLHYAAINGNIAVVEVLTDNRADVNVPNQWKKTPLQYALEEGHLKIAELLIRKGADRKCVPAYINKRSQEKGKVPAFIVAGISAIVIQQVLFHNTELSKYAIIGASIASMILAGGIAYGIAYMWSKHVLSSTLDKVKVDDGFSAEKFKLYID